MTQIDKVMQIIRGDHTSQRIQVNGYPVTLRFSRAPAPEICTQIKSILLSSIALDNHDSLWDDCANKKTAESEESE